MKEEIVMRDSDEAASYRTDISGWVSRDGRFFGKDESLARFSGSTHGNCECGNIMEKSWNYCSQCRSRKYIEDYYKMPHLEWDGETPLCLYDADVYFFDQGEIEDYIEDEEIQSIELKFVICKRNIVPHVDIYDHIENIAPEEMDNAPKELVALFDKLNNGIDEFNKTNTISWIGGKHRTTIDIGVEENEESEM